MGVLCIGRKPRRCHPSHILMCFNFFYVRECTHVYAAAVEEQNQGRARVRQVRMQRRGTDSITSVHKVPAENWGIMPDIICIQESTKSGIFLPTMSTKDRTSISKSSSKEIVWGHNPRAEYLVS